MNTSSIVLLFLSVIVEGPAFTTQSKPQPARTPEEAIQQLESAMQKGDSDALFSTMSRRDLEYCRKLTAAIQASEKATDALNDALESVFGKEARLPEVEKLDFKKTMRPDKAAKLIILDKTAKADGSIEFNVRGTWTVDFKNGSTTTSEKKFTLVKEDGAWKTDGDSIGMPQGGNAALEFFNRSTRAYEQVAADLKAGKVKRGEVSKALQKAREAGVSEKK